MLLVAQEALTDVAFTQALAGGELFDDAAAFARWRELRPRYERLRDEVFTLRHVLRSSEIDPWRMLSSAFLHGGAGHLIGNMIFLGALGLLVEGALGAWRFAAVYVLGALGSSAVSLWWRWGESGGGLGASGAIAALMGTFCLVYGRQPVRFFYWIGVVFDYVRAPAIWLFPAWLGWEVYNLLANGDLGIGFDAHAGGLVTAPCSAPCWWRRTRCARISSRTTARPRPSTIAGRARRRIWGAWNCARPICCCRSCRRRRRRASTWRSHGSAWHATAGTPRRARRARSIC